MSPGNHISLQKRAAFTLIELLVVITIIALLLAIGAPSVLHSIKSSRLTGAGEKLLGALSEAQQEAFSRNCIIEVHFYKQGADEVGGVGTGLHYRGYQFFKIVSATQDTTHPDSGAKIKRGDEIATRFGPYAKLPDNVMISGEVGLSPSLETSDDKDAISALRFLPDGTCRKVKTLTSGSVSSVVFPTLPESYLTVIEDDGKDYTSEAPPKNFYTIQTDPYTGKSRSYRPGF